MSGSEDQTFRVWDVKNGKTILILATMTRMSKEEDDYVWAVCDCSPDAMIATGGDIKYGLKASDANTGELLKVWHGPRMEKHFLLGERYSTPPLERKLLAFLSKLMATNSMKLTRLRYL